MSNVELALLDHADAALVLTGDATIDTETGAISGIRTAGDGDVDGIWFGVEAQSGGVDVGVFVVAGLEIPSGVTLTATGANPLVLLSSDDVSVDGTLDASGADGTDGLSAGGTQPGGTGAVGAGSGGTGLDNDASGATDGAGESPGGARTGGVHYGNGGGPTGDGSLSPLHAGSGGAGGVADTDHNPNGDGSGGGAGGGGLQVSVDGSLDVAGTITVAGGQAGDAYAGGGGGGATESGGGGGDAGWIRVRTLDGATLDGTVSPDSTTGCVSDDPI